MPETEMQGSNGTAPGTLAEAAEQLAADHEGQIADERRRFERVLPVKLTEDEVADRARIMADLRQKREELADKRKQEAAALKEEIDELDAQLDQVASEVREGATQHSIECAEGLDYSGNHMLIVRLDTNELVEERPLTMAERQGALELEEDGGGDGPPDEDAEEEEPGFHD